jgi:hypothetical protein
MRIKSRRLSRNLYRKTRTFDAIERSRISCGRLIGFNATRRVSELAALAFHAPPGGDFLSIRNAEITIQKKAIPAAARRELAARHGCQPGGSARVVCDCGKIGYVHWLIRNRQKMGWVSFEELEIDHVMPEYEGGSSDPDNLRLCCRTCNRSKGHRVN